MKTGISIKHNSGVSIYGGEKDIAEALAGGTPLPLSEEQQDDFGDFFELQTAKLREEASVNTPLTPLPTDIIGMRGDLNRVVPAGFIMLYNKLDEIQKESSQNGGGFLGGFGGGGTGGAVNFTPAVGEAVQQAAVAATAAAASAGEAASSATAAQEAARQAQQAVASAAASNAEVSNPAVSQVSIPLDPFRIDLAAGARVGQAVGVSKQTAETQDPFKVALSTIGMASAVDLARVSADVDAFRVDLDNIQVSSGSQAQQIQQIKTQLANLATFDTGIGQQVTSLEASIQENFSVVDNSINSLNLRVTTVNSRISDVYSALSGQISSLETQVENLSTPTVTPTATPDFSTSVSTSVQEVVTAIVEGDVAQQAEIVGEALEAVGLDADTIAVVEGIAEAVTEAAEIATAGTPVVSEEDKIEHMKQLAAEALLKSQLSTGQVPRDTSGTWVRQNQTTISDPNAATIPILGPPQINPVAAQANPNFAQTAGQQFAIAPSQLGAGSYLPAGAVPGVTATVLTAGVGMAM